MALLWFEEGKGSKLKKKKERQTDGSIEMDKEM
jgi:hypothetical protein